MSEEVKIKISQPMFEVGELEGFDNNIHSIVEEYSKMLLHEKDQILTQRIIMKQEEEIKRLNNIINELEKYFFGQLQMYGGGGTAQEYYDKLQELKGSDKE